MCLSLPLGGVPPCAQLTADRDSPRIEPECNQLRLGLFQAVVTRAAHAAHNTAGSLSGGCAMSCGSSGPRVRSHKTQSAASVRDRARFSARGIRGGLRSIRRGWLLQVFLPGRRAGWLVADDVRSLRGPYDRWEDRAGFRRGLLPAYCTAQVIRAEPEAFEQEQPFRSR